MPEVRLDIARLIQLKDELAGCATRECKILQCDLQLEDKQKCSKKFGGKAKHANITFPLVKVLEQVCSRTNLVQREVISVNKYSGAQCWYRRSE